MHRKHVFALWLALSLLAAACAGTATTAAPQPTTAPQATAAPAATTAGPQ